MGCFHRQEKNYRCKINGGKGLDENNGRNRNFFYMVSFFGGKMESTHSCHTIPS